MVIKEPLDWNSDGIFSSSAAEEGCENTHGEQHERCVYDSGRVCVCIYSNTQRGEKHNNTKCKGPIFMIYDTVRSFVPHSWGKYLTIFAPKVTFLCWPSTTPHPKAKPLLSPVFTAACWKNSCSVGPFHTLEGDRRSPGAEPKPETSSGAIYDITTEWNKEDPQIFLISQKFMDRRDHWQVCVILP